MSELKDPKIKLFGKTIELPEKIAPTESIGPVSARCGESATEEHSSPDPPCSSSPMLEDSNFNADKDLELIESLSDPKEGAAKEEDQSLPVTSDDLKDSSTSQPITEEKSPAADNNTGSPKTSKTEGGNNETSNSQDKTLKKPDKIIPCPRCNSMDTKFCYFNNYNVNQPRHFCKNCQRYWTAGGSMRNVPVGAGRRKNKNSVSQFRHLTVPEGARLDLANGNHHPTLNLNGTVLTFSSDGPLCESMASVLNIADKTIQNNPRNGYHKPEEQGIPVSSSRLSKDNGGEILSGSSSTMSNGAISSHEAGNTGLPELTSNHHPFPMQVPCYPGAPWPYPWSSIPWNPVMPPNTTFRPSTFPIPFYTTPPPPYWACSVSGAWNVPWIIPPSASSQSQASSGSGPNSPTLGKHSRDGNAITPGSSKEDKSIEESDCEEKSPLVPKTLRIDNPEEAAKSSIWVTLGIKNDTTDSVSGSRMFKAFQGQQQQSKGDEKTRVSETSTVLQANPAALSRSLSFHESS